MNLYSFPLDIRIIHLEFTPTVLLVHSKKLDMLVNNFKNESSSGGKISQAYCLGPYFARLEFIMLYH